jgi:hypothetical protein
MEWCHASSGFSAETHFHPHASSSSSSGSFIEGQEVDSGGGKPGLTQVPSLVCCMLIREGAGNNCSKPSSKPGGVMCWFLCVRPASALALLAWQWRSTLLACQGSRNESKVKCPTYSRHCCLPCSFSVCAACTRLTAFLSEERTQMPQLLITQRRR